MGDGAAAGDRPRFVTEGSRPEPPVADYGATPRTGSAWPLHRVRLPFEIAAVILLVAIIAAIALTMRRRPDTKYQDPAARSRCAARTRWSRWIKKKIGKQAWRPPPAKTGRATGRANS
jgi:hypothetical protein